jgi:hypothetical protein
MRVARATDVSDPVEAPFRSADAGGRAAAEWLRKLVTGLGVDLVEKPQAGWQALTYHHPEAGYVVGIFPRAGHAQLVIEHGASMEEFAALFDSVGKQVGTVVVTSVPDARGDRIEDVILAAIAMRTHP